MRRAILLAGLACGVLLSATVRASEAADWSALTPGEQVLVEAVAADLWREAGGRVPYALIGETEKAAVRREAIRRLGARKAAVDRRWV